MNFEITCDECANDLELVSGNLKDGLVYECPNCNFKIILDVKA